MAEHARNESQAIYPQFTLRGLFTATGLFALGLCAAKLSLARDNTALFFFPMAGAAFGGAVGILTGHYWQCLNIGFWLPMAIIFAILV